MPIWGWVIVAVLLLGSRKAVAQNSTAAQNGPGVNSNNLVTSLLNALTRGQQSGSRASGSPSGGPGSSGAAHGNPTAGTQSRGNMGQQNVDGSYVDSGDGLSGFLSSFEPGTTLGDAIEASGYDDFRTGLSEITGVDVGQPQSTDSDTTGLIDLIPTGDGSPFPDSTSADGSSGDPWGTALGLGDGGSQADYYADGDSTYDGGDAGGGSFDGGGF